MKGKHIKSFSKYNESLDKFLGIPSHSINSDLIDDCHNILQELIDDNFNINITANINNIIRISIKSPNSSGLIGSERISKYSECKLYIEQLISYLDDNGFKLFSFYSMPTNSYTIGKINDSDPFQSVELIFSHR
jgi:hypothetical protein